MTSLLTYRYPLALLLLALVRSSVLAAPTPNGSKTLCARSAHSTPSITYTPPATYADYDTGHIAELLEAMAAAARSDTATLETRSLTLDDAKDIEELQPRASKDETALKSRQAPSTRNCLDSTATDQDINALYFYGGANTTVLLCPGARISLAAPIFFTAPDQVLSTLGNPQGDTRATLAVAGEQQANAIYGSCDACTGVQVRSLQVYGARDSLGQIEDGLALIAMGGAVTGQVVQHVRAWEPRGWSALHAIEGHELSCSNIKILNNQIGPCGHAPNDGHQFKRQVGGVISPGQWADGISHACRDSEVAFNTVTDATDGGIVIFGAPGSNIHDNTIRAISRRGLGGINMVDFDPFGGSFLGTVVQNNRIVAESDMIKLGIAMGGMSWGSDNRTAARTFGGVVQHNILSSGPSGNGYFEFAISIAGHENATVVNNNVSGASFGGKPSDKCIPEALPPTPRALVVDESNSPGGNLQDGFENETLVFLVCAEPGPIVSRPVSATIISPSTTRSPAQSTQIKSAIQDVVGAVQIAEPTANTGAVMIGNLIRSAWAAAASAAASPSGIPRRALVEASTILSAPMAKRTPPTPSGMVNPFAVLAAANT